MGCCVSHFNVSLILWAKSQDSVHKAQFLKRKENRTGSNRGPSAYQRSTFSAVLLKGRRGRGGEGKRVRERKRKWGGGRTSDLLQSVRGFFSFFLTYFVSSNGPCAPKKKWHRKEHIFIIITAKPNRLTIH